MNKSKTAKKTIYVSIVGNIALVLLKGVAGLLGSSFALVADAIESFTDLVSSVLVLLGFKYAERPPDENHPYGHGKIEPLITLIVVMILLSAAGIIAFQSIQNIQTPHPPPKAWTLIVLLGIILWKEGLYRFVSKKNKDLNSSSLRAEAWHHRSDAISSLLAFIGISISVIGGESYETADDWAAIGASLLILYNGYFIFRPALSELMDEHRHDDLIEAVRKKSLEVSSVLGTEKCFVRKVGMYYQVDLHAIVPGDLSVRKGHEISHDLKDHLLKELPEISNVFIHIEPEECLDVNNM